MVLKWVTFTLLLSYGMSSWSYVGEKDFGHYYGPFSPEYKYDDYQSSLIFLDKSFEKDYFNLKIESKLTGLGQFFEGEFYNGMTCPNELYNKEKTYMTYLNRLIVLSYLFEALRDYEFTAKQFGGQKSHSCFVNWKKELERCDAKGSDMSSFIRNAIHLSSNIETQSIPYVLSKKKAKRSWMHDYENGRYSTISQHRLRSYCLDQKCSRLTEKRLLERMGTICLEDKKLFKNVCSESDRLYGLSKVPEAQYLISTSDAIRAMENSAYAKGCLRRFSRDSKRKEVKSSSLKDLFPAIYENLTKNKKAYLQGRLFSIGALKEFSDKGLENIFEEKKENVIVAVKKETVPIVEPKFKKIKLAKVVTKKKNKKNVAKKKIKKKKEIKSSFLTASLFRKKLSLERLSVDMEKFGYDFIFTLSLIEKIKPVVKKFSTYKSLADMKKFDSLGTKQAPIPLKFLKFMIDREMHKELYNITNVIGQSFYVRNDIDKNVKDIEFIKIENNESTNYLWQIEILTPLDDED